MGNRERTKFQGSRQTFPLICMSILLLPLTQSVLWKRFFNQTQEINISDKTKSTTGMEASTELMRGVVMQSIKRTGKVPTKMHPTNIQLDTL